MRAEQHPPPDGAETLGIHSQTTPLSSQTPNSNMASPSTGIDGQMQQSSAPSSDGQQQQSQHTPTQQHHQLQSQQYPHYHHHHPQQPQQQQSFSSSSSLLLQQQQQPTQQQLLQHQKSTTLKQQQQKHGKSAELTSEISITNASSSSRSDSVSSGDTKRLSFLVANSGSPSGNVSQAGSGTGEIWEDPVQQQSSTPAPPPSSSTNNNQKISSTGMSFSH